MKTPDYSNEKLAEYDVVNLGHLDSDQVYAMLIFLFATKIFLTFPSDISSTTGTAAWITIGISGIFASVGFWGWVKWSNSTGNLGFIPSLRITLGKILGDITALLIIMYFLMITSFSARVFAGGAILGLLPEFPIELLLFIIIVCAIYAAWLGLEPVAKAASFFYPFINISIIVVGLGSWKLFDIRNLHPILGMGVPTIFKQSINGIGIFGGIPAIAIFKSYLKNPSKLSRAAYRSLTTATLILITGVLMVLTTLPYPENTRHVISIGVISRTIHLGRFLQRLEAIFTFTWFFASAVHASICYMINLILLAQLINIRTYRPLVPSVGLLTFGVAALPSSILAAGKLLAKVYIFGGSICVSLGLVLHLVSLARNTGKRSLQISKAINDLKEAPEYSEDIYEN